jgi:hypothetical protein
LNFSVRVADPGTAKRESAAVDDDAGLLGAAAPAPALAELAGKQRPAEALDVLLDQGDAEGKRRCAGLFGEHLLERRGREGGRDR